MCEEEIILHTVNLLEVQSCGKHFDLVDGEKILSFTLLNLGNGASELN